MIRRAKPSLGTLVEIAIVPSPSLTQQQANDAIALAFKRIEHISNSLSFHAPNSELSQLNANPTQWIPMGQDGMRVLRLAKAIGRLSHNGFNCTVGGELVQQGALPLNVKHGFLAQGHWQDIELKLHHAKLNRPVLITLDGIAKGYAVDMAVSTLHRLGIEGGWVNAGGDLKVFGSASLPLQQRRKTGLSKVIMLTNIALASSRVSKGFDIDYPALIISGDATKASNENDEQIVSVSARFAWRADALTKIAACANSENAFQQIDDLGGTIMRFDTMEPH